MDEDTLNEVITIVKSFHSNNDDDDFTFCINYTVDEILKHLELYRKGKYVEWLKKNKDTKGEPQYDGIVENELTNIIVDEIKDI